MAKFPNNQILPNELSFDDIKFIQENIGKGEKLKDVLLQYFPDKLLAICYVKDKLDGSFDYDGVDLWLSQAIYNNRKDERSSILEFCMTYHLTEKPTTFWDLTLLTEYEQNKIFRQLEELIANMVIESKDAITFLDPHKKNREEANIKPPVSQEDYKETLKKLSREDIIEQLVKSGIPLDEANEFADEVDEDR